MGEIEKVVMGASKPRTVIRRGAVTRGTDGRIVPAANVEAIALLVVQPLGGSALARQLEGDGVTGAVAVWTSTTALASAYLASDNTKTPLGWTSLQCAPAIGSEGPPGDIVIWQSRRFEVTAIEVYDDDGLIPMANIRRYIATERKIAP